MLLQINLSFSPQHAVNCISIFTLLAFSAISCTTESTPSYQLTTSSVPTEGGSVSPASGEYDEGTEVQVQATANENWVFDGWQGDQTGSQNPMTVTMDADKMVSALFVKRQYPLTINYDGEGTVTETVVPTKMTDYEHGTVVELEANPGTGHNFGRWTGDVESTDNPVQITVDGPKEVTIIFEPMKFDVQINANGPGKVSVEPEKDLYVYNETVIFTAVPDEDIQFVGWFNDSGSFEMLQAEFEYQVTQNLDITAFFRTVENAFSVETVSISVADGEVESIRFDVTNFLLNDVHLIGADLNNDEGEEAGTLRFDDPFTLPARTVLELTATFSGDERPDSEEIKNWIFTWLFDFQGERYEKEQEVGEPSSNTKQKLLPWESVEIRESVLVDIK